MGHSVTVLFNRDAILLGRANGIDRAARIHRGEVQKDLRRRDGTKMDKHQWERSITEKKRDGDEAYCPILIKPRDRGTRTVTKRAPSSFLFVAAFDCAVVWLLLAIVEK